jgi:hypothetical protein
VRTILRNGLDRYEVLKADEPLRRGERLVRFASERGALEFLIGVGGPARRDLHRLVDDDFAGEFSSVRKEEVPAQLALRLIAGQLRIAQVVAAPPRVRGGGAEFEVLSARDRLRRGESWVRVMDEATAVRFARLLTGLPKEQQRRLILVAAAVGGGSQREQTRSLSRLLLRGQIRIVRVQTLTHAGSSAPPEPEVSAFGVADAISLGVGLIPVFGDAVDIAGAIVGKDLITGEKLTPAERWVTAAGTLVGSGKAARMGMGLVDDASKLRKAGKVVRSTPINISERGLNHVLERHTAGGAKSAGKSIFNGSEDVVSLIQEAERVSPVQQGTRKTFERVVDAGREIGVDRTSNSPTSIYTVITNEAGELVTAFPGLP